MLKFREAQNSIKEWKGQTVDLYFTGLPSSMLLVCVCASGEGEVCGCEEESAVLGVRPTLSLTVAYCMRLRGKDTCFFFNLNFS